MKDQNNDDYFEKQSPSTLRSIGGLLTFSTILPLNVIIDFFNNTSFKRLHNYR